MGFSPRTLAAMAIFMIASMVAGCLTPAAPPAEGDAEPSDLLIVARKQGDGVFVYYMPRSTLEVRQEGFAEGEASLACLTVWSPCASDDPGRDGFSEWDAMSYATPLTVMPSAQSACSSLACEDLLPLFTGFDLPATATPLRECKATTDDYRRWDLNQTNPQPCRGENITYGVPFDYFNQPAHKNKYPEGWFDAEPIPRECAASCWDLLERYDILLCGMVDGREQCRMKKVEITTPGGGTVTSGQVVAAIKQGALQAIASPLADWQAPELFTGDNSLVMPDYNVVGGSTYSVWDANSFSSTGSVYAPFNSGYTSGLTSAFGIAVALYVVAGFSDDENASAPEESLPFGPVLSMYCEPVGDQVICLVPSITLDVYVAPDEGEASPE